MLKPASAFMMPHLGIHATMKTLAQLMTDVRQISRALALGIVYVVMARLTTMRSVMERTIVLTALVMMAGSLT